MSQSHSSILLIDQDEIDTMVTSQMLADADAGFRVASCESIGQAIEFLHSGPDVNLILMDLVFPDGTGQRAIDQVVIHSGDLPVMVLSTWEEPFLRKLRSSRVSCFLQKHGLSLPELTGSIETLLDRGDFGARDARSDASQRASVDCLLHRHVRTEASVVEDHSANRGGLDSDRLVAPSQREPLEAL